MKEILLPGVRQVGLEPVDIELLADAVLFRIRHIRKVLLQTNIEAFTRESLNEENERGTEILLTLAGFLGYPPEKTEKWISRNASFVEEMTPGHRCDPAGMSCEGGGRKVHCCESDSCYKATCKSCAEYPTDPTVRAKRMREHEEYERGHPFGYSSLRIL